MRGSHAVLEDTMNRTAAFRIGIWISVGLAALDIAGVFTFGMDDAPTPAVIVA